MLLGDAIEGIAAATSMVAPGAIGFGCAVATAAGRGAIDAGRCGVAGVTGSGAGATGSGNDDIWAGPVPRLPGGGRGAAGELEPS